jgi:hypothetical protein
MNKYQKIYSVFFAIIIVAFGVYFFTGQQLKDVKKKSRRIAQNLRSYKNSAVTVYQHKESIRLNKENLNKRSKGELEMPTVLKMARSNNIKSPRSSADDIVDKRTWREKHVDLNLKDEKLKNVVKFLNEIEGLGDANVKNITFMRNKKDKDLWSATVSVVKIIPKKD